MSLKVHILMLILVIKRTQECDPRRKARASTRIYWTFNVAAEGLYNESMMGCYIWGAEWLIRD